MTDPHPPNTTPRKPEPMFDSYKWPLIIVGFLMFDVLLFAGVIIFTSNDHATSVESDYYAKGLAWDQQRADNARIIEFFGEPELTVGALNAGSDQPEAVVVLPMFMSEAESPALPPTLSLEYFHNARSASRFKQGMTHDAGQPGRYTAPLTFDGGGLWVIRINVSYEDRNAVFEHERLIKPAADGG